jgi:glycosyltransferase involved in cell wall biosynthesis
MHTDHAGAPSQPFGSTRSYVLITPARNEAAHLPGLIASVIAQTELPKRWVIVDDGSTDNSIEIISRYLAAHPWMQLVARPVRQTRSFAGKAAAFEAGYEALGSLDYDVIGNIDADVTFEADYFEFLMERFAADPNLGCAGTTFTEGDYSSATDSFEGHQHVAGGCQLFRRACFTDVGGYVRTKIGMDWIAVTTARMKGWRTRAFDERTFFHHRELGTAERGKARAAMLYGEKDYRLGWHPLYQLVRVGYRFIKNPAQGVLLGVGYCSAMVRRIERPVSAELIRFNRAEQMGKLRAIAGSLMRGQSLNKFTLDPRRRA